MKKKSRTEYSVMNTTVAFAAQATAILMGFFTRVIFTRMLSEGYVGINGLFNDILNILSLSELGVGTAITYALYGPIAKKDIKKQQILMRMFRTFYQATAGVVLLVKAEMADEVAARVEDAGVFVVPKPLNRALLFGAVKLAQAANRRIMGLQRQNNILQQKIDDIRLVDRAKCALIQYRLLTEPEAHRYIEREAMDSRRTRREVAQAILRMYEGGC